ncbi:hypothetical protein VST7929_02814 [Vibrio stylophorae]|uniref:Cupin type-2 domain-containing protein n=1 Tax=Vibrio stylophorae TaxID=659351 RepID=A0ABM8ZWY6_9VIBR|nr:cupin domain-containing protein [Vibrio stylophorae]CAH0535153.1 hypothetical protein VST7929_02814 [Vibrio stylophorae]
MTHRVQNLFTNIPDRFSQELCDILVSHPTCRIERIVSKGHATPDSTWYDQAEDEWVCVLKGEGTLLFEQGESVVLGVGDSLLIPAHQKHRVQLTTPHDPTIWLAVFYGAQ